MASSREKKRFLKSMPTDITYRWGGGYCIPPEYFLRINRLHLKNRNAHSCKDIRDFLTRLALEGLAEANSGGDIMQISTEYALRCKKEIFIDYSVIDHAKLMEFNGYVNGHYVRSVQDAVSYCIILGYMNRIGRVTCVKDRVATPIYS